MIWELFDNLELKVVNILFKRYLQDSSDAIKEQLEKNKKGIIANHASNNISSRKERREAKNTDIYVRVTNKNIDNEIIFIKEAQTIMDYINNSKSCYPVSQSDFEKIIYFIWHSYVFDQEVLKDPNVSKRRKNAIEQLNENVYRQTLQFFIKNAKKHTEETNEFLDCFNNKGEIIPEKIIEYKYILERIYYRREKLHYYPKDFTCDKLTGILYEKEVYDEQREKQYLENKILQEKKLKARKEAQEIKKILRARASKLSIEKNNIKKSTNETVNRDLYNKYSNYLDLRSMELKKNVTEIISESDLLNLISELPHMTKSLLSYYKDSYESLYIENQILNIISIIGPSNAIKFKDVLKDNPDTLEAITELILSEEYTNMSNEEIKNSVLDIINLEKNTSMTNMIIFSNSDLLDSTYETIINSSTESATSLIRNINHQLITLQSNSIEQLKQGGSDQFHTIKGDYQDYETDDGLKGYRFGKRKSKVCYFKASISAHNKQKLQEYFQLPSSSDLLLVFGVGNVKAENEDDLYIRCKKNAEDHKEEISYINKLLQEPFTENTFNYIVNLINTDNDSIQKNNYIYNNLEEDNKKRR